MLGARSTWQRHRPGTWGQDSGTFSLTGFEAGTSTSGVQCMTAKLRDPLPRVMGGLACCQHQRMTAAARDRCCLSHRLSHGDEGGGGGGSTRTGSFVGHARALLCSPVRSCVLLCAPVFSCALLCSPVRSCVLLCAPVFSCALLCSPVRSCVLLCAPVFSCALLCSPVRSCVLLCAPVFSCALLCSPVRSVRLRGRARARAMPSISPSRRVRGLRHRRGTAPPSPHHQRVVADAARRWVSLHLMTRAVRGLPRPVCEGRGHGHRGPRRPLSGGR